MTSILQQEWLNCNAGRAYPFQEDMSRYPVMPDGSVIESAQLPNYVVVDFVFAVPTTNQATRLYLKQLALVGNLMTLVWGESAGLDTIGTLTVDLSTHSANTGYDITGTGDWMDAYGRVVIGDLADLHTDLADGLYNYSPGQTLLEMATVRPSIRGVRSLRIQNRENISDRIYGNIKLVAGDNITLSYSAETNAIIVTAAPSEAYREPCDCEESDATNNIVKTINGIPVEDIEIVGDDCVEVQKSGNTLRLTDKCSKPCCGCPELQFITDSLKVLDSTLGRLESFSAMLSERIQTFVTSYILTARM